MMAIDIIAATYLLEITWADVIEISCFIVIGYIALAWLNKDTQTNLVAYSCIWYSLLFFAWTIGFKALSILLFSCTPMAIALLIILHQTYIQRQYLSLRTAYGTAESTDDWCDELIKQTLIMMNHNIPVTWYIEYTHGLDALLYVEGKLHAHITTQLIDIIMMSKKPVAPLYLWVRVNGPMLGIDPHLHINEQNCLMATDCSLLSPWQRKALLLSHCTDAIVLQGNPLQRTCALYVQGKIIEQLTPHHAVSLLKHYLSSSVTLSKDHVWKNGSTHGSFVAPGHVQSGRSSSDTPRG